MISRRRSAADNPWRSNWAARLRIAVDGLMPSTALILAKRSLPMTTLATSFLAEDFFRAGMLNHTTKGDGLHLRTQRPERLPLCRE